MVQSTSHENSAESEKTRTIVSLYAEGNEIGYARITYPVDNSDPAILITSPQMLSYRELITKADTLLLKNCDQIRTNEGDKSSLRRGIGHVGVWLKNTGIDYRKGEVYRYNSYRAQAEYIKHCDEKTIKNVDQYPIQDLLSRNPSKEDDIQIRLYLQAIDIAAEIAMQIHRGTPARNL